MKPVRLVTRLMLAACVVSAPFISPAQPKAADANTTQGEAAMAAEVRLRKLHLVRPDLIPYPIAYEVCC